MTDLIPRDAAVAAVNRAIWKSPIKAQISAIDASNDTAEALRAIPAIDPAAIREAALREAVKSLRDWQNNLIHHRYKETAITVGMSADAVEALIGEKK